MSTKKNSLLEKIIPNSNKSNNNSIDDTIINNTTVNVYFETYGCAVNISDTEVMKGVLKKNGYKIVKDLKEANVIIINTCTVKRSTFNRFQFILDKYSKLKDKKLIFAGCITQTNLDLLKDYSALGVEQVDNICEVIQETLKGNVIHLVARSNKKRLNLPKVRKNNIIEIIPISKGCLGNCSYCKVKIARGNLVSYDKDDIINEIKQAVSENIFEIWLTSQDNGAYGKDKDTNIIELIDEILDIPGNFKIRLGMSNPNFVYEYILDFVSIFENEKMFKFIHIPLQAGSNKVLSDMNRKYTKEQYLTINKKLRDRFPNFTIATDIICGFPTESEDDFEETIEIIEKTKPDIINVSQYSAMDKTPAAKLKQLQSQIIKKRSTKVSKLNKKISEERNKVWIGWKGKVFVDEKGKENTFISRNDEYKSIIISQKDFKEKIELGKFYEVEVVDTNNFDLIGKPFRK
jgi:threonylcarbamoyladenosine tRNA methylthiotransferase CDKAL1